MDYKYWEFFPSFEVWQAINAESLHEISNLSLLQIRWRNLCCFSCILGKMSFFKEKVLFPFCLRGESTMSISGNEQSLQDISEVLAVEGEISALLIWEVAQVVQVS